MPPLRSREDGIEHHAFGFVMLETEGSPYTDPSVTSQNRAGDTSPKGEAKSEARVLAFDGQKLAGVFDGGFGIGTGQHSGQFQHAFFAI